MKIRFICASAAAALGFAWSSNTFAKMVVAYAPPTVVYFPPRSPYQYAPPPAYIVPVVPAGALPAVVTEVRWHSGQRAGISEKSDTE